MSAEQITDKQLCWEYIKYEENFLFPFPKKMPKKTHAQIATLENELKRVFLTATFRLQNKLEQIYEEKATDVKIRSKCEWYKFGEKSSKFFLNLEKQLQIKSSPNSFLY